jgi:starch-binding outer membrane protein, SusD/RagB family
MMKRYSIALLLFCFLFSIHSCELLEPDMDNRLTDEQMLTLPDYWEGLLLHAYKSQFSGTQYDFNLDVASDDAVTNDPGSNYLRMATGEWTAQFSPASQWNAAYKELFYVNLFLEEYEEVEWSYESEEINSLHLQRLKGEAYALRAWYHFLLLQAHGGRADNGDLLGVPYLTEVLDKDDDFNLPRDSYAYCVEQILQELDTAIELLPWTYRNYTRSEVESGALPEKFQHITSHNVFNNTMGERFRNRFNGMIAHALKSRVALYAASPAFGVLSWEEAATIAGDFLAESGGLAALPAAGLTFYKNYQNPEIIWNNAKSLNNNLEQDNYPPSQFGNGRTNPTQELVNSFPMANGFPIIHQLSGYQADNPYAGRDPRLSLYIVYNGNTVKSTVNTYVGAPNDGVGSLITSTRTGYYLKKLLLDEQVNLEPGNVTQGERFYTYFRFTEIFLNFAEAANEAWGPDADPNGYGFTARGVLREIRGRAGLAQPDTYLQFFTSSVNAFRDLVHTERRIELCFEGQRFWDIRRWDKTGIMQAPVSGMMITPGETNSYEEKIVEEREYMDYMIYGPIPYNELLQNSNLEQNSGW